MQLETTPATDAHCVRDVAVLSGELSWESVGVGYVLVVCGAYNTEIVIDDMVRAALEGSGTDLLRSSGAPLDLPDGRSVALLRRGAIRSDVYRCTRRHARYAVFGCAFDQAAERLTVFVPQGARAACDVPGLVRVSVVPRWVEKGAGLRGRLFGRAPEKVLAGYALTVTLEGAAPANGDLGLWYEFDGCDLRYPVTPDMLGKTLYVLPWRATSGGQPAGPTVKTRGEGFEVVAA